MAIHCPYCRHTLALKFAKSGRYTARCPKCAQKILVAVPSEPGEAAIVSTLPAEQDEGSTMTSSEAVEKQLASAKDPHATGLFPSPVTTQADDPGATALFPTPCPADDPGATGLFPSPEEDDDEAGSDPGRIGRG